MDHLIIPITDETMNTRIFELLKEKKFESVLVDETLGILEILVDASISKEGYDKENPTTAVTLLYKKNAYKMASYVTRKEYMGWPLTKKYRVVNSYNELFYLIDGHTEPPIWLPTVED